MNPVLGVRCATILPGMMLYLGSLQSGELGTEGGAFIEISPVHNISLCSTFAHEYHQGHARPEV